MLKKLILVLMVLCGGAIGGHAVDTVNTIPTDPNGNRPAVLWGNSGYSVAVDSNGNVGVNASVVVPPVTVTFPEFLPFNLVSSVTVSNLSDLVTSSFVYTKDQRYYDNYGTVKKSSGIAEWGIVTGVTSYTFTSADPVCYWQIQLLDDVNQTTWCTLSSDYRGIIGKYHYYDYDSGIIEPPIAANFYLTGLAVTTTVQFRIDTRKP